MPTVIEHNGGLLWSRSDEFLFIEGAGRDGLRVRSGLGQVRSDLPGALLDTLDGSAIVSVEGETACITQGRIRAELTIPTGRVVFVRADSGQELLAEAGYEAGWSTARRFQARGGGTYRLDQKFVAYPDEKVFGLGQHSHGLLDQKNTVTELIQRNGEVAIPFLLSSRGYGFLWNNPAIGQVEITRLGTRWIADRSRQIDYWVTAGAPLDILASYADATGHAPTMPDWGTGYWQSKLRYKSQEQLLAVAREHVRRGLPLSVIVADYFHWSHLGDWAFDPEAWPDPEAMVRELDALGVKLAVSVWASVNPHSRNYPEMLEGGLLIRTEHGTPAHTLFPDWGFGPTMQGVSFYDATQPAARAYVWGKVRENYLSRGISVWWLDACEPEIWPEQFENLRFSAGPGAEVANLYPREHARGFAEGMAADGHAEPLALIRSAWAGSQRYGTLLWSGDIHTTWESLRQQVVAGLNVGISGIPWWTFDIGGFHGGDPDDDAYRELYVRWFQFAVFSPVLRAHGHREPRDEFVVGHDGGPNEIWSYGPAVGEILEQLLFLRERLRPYLRTQYDFASRSGAPLMRALFLEFPDDPRCWEVDDEYLFGRDLLVAPVLAAGVRERSVYLPVGASWTDGWTGESYIGGQDVVVGAPLDRIPVFLRDGADIALSD